MFMHHLLAWSAFLVGVLGLLAFDLLVLHRNPHELKFREALLGTLAPMIAAALFTVVLFFAYQQHWLELGLIPSGTPPMELEYWPDTGAEAILLFVTGYVVELSLSADNVFLFLILMRFFVVPAHLQHRVLFWGVLGALVMRAIMILAGAALLAQFGWVIYLFGAFLVFTGVKMLFSSEQEGQEEENFAVRLTKKFIPIKPGFHGQRFFLLEREPLAESQAAAHPGKGHPKKGKLRLYGTTLLVVLIAIEFTDLVFALDSIPAIFGITRDPFIVFTSNVFAILGLRSMYFLLAGVMDKFHLLRYGLAFVLAFVGVKMLLPGMGHLYGSLISAQEHSWHVNKFVALGVILLALTISVVASLMFPAKPKTQKHASEHTFT